MSVSSQAMLYNMRCRAVAWVVLAACAPRSSPGPAIESSTPVHAEGGEPAAASAVEPGSSVAESELPFIPPDPSEQVDFDPSALSFGPCRPLDSQPFVVGHGVEAWSEGEPLWVMTNAGGAIRAAAGKRFEYCGVGISKPAEASGSADEVETCVPAWTLVTASPLRCDEPLRSSLPERLAERGGHDLSLVFAIHRRHLPPTLVPMTFEVRVHAVCQDPDKDFDEPGAKIPVEDAAMPIDRRFAQQVPEFGRQHWRAIRVSPAGASGGPLHVLHTAEARNVVKRSQWFVFREHADGSVTSLVTKADRVWHDSPMARERQCGLPYIVPFPVLSFIHDGKLHWVTGMDSEKIEARVWEVGDERLRHLHTLSVALDAPKG